MSDDIINAVMDRSQPVEAETVETEVEAQAPEAEQTAEAAPEAEGQKRDEKGRFAASEQEQKPAEPTAAQAAEQERPASVPPSRLREEADARRAAEARASQLEAQVRLLTEMYQRGPQQRQEEKKPEAQVDPVDQLLTDPSAFLRSQIDPIEQRYNASIEHFSRRDAVREHGEEKVNEAYQALSAAIQAGEVNRDVAINALRQSMDPFGDIMNWHRQHSIARDPAAFEKQLRAQIMAELQTQQSAASGVASTSQPATQIKIPASLSRATAAASSSGQGGDPGSGDVVGGILASRGR